MPTILLKSSKFEFLLTYSLISVKMKRKHFNTFEEKQKFIETYTKKKKTELCKNY